MTVINEQNKENVEEKRKKRKFIIIILILLIIFVLLAYILGYKIGRIGLYQEIEKPVFNQFVKIIKVTDENVNITDDTQLDIFENEKYENNKMIAPGSSGKYSFYIENISNSNIVYDIYFTDEMTNKINMKYKLKLDNVYAKGNKNKYVSIKKLNVNDVIIMRNSTNMYTLEWYWEDDDKNDTYVGSQKTPQYYTLRLKVNARIMD